MDRKGLFLTVVSIFILSCTKGQADVPPPFPQAEIPTEVLSLYYPQIMQEVAQEFAHQNDGRTRRDTREYGFSFFKMCNGDFSYEEFPPFLQGLGDSVCEYLGHEKRCFNNIILSLYEEGFRLEPHIDAYDLYRFDSNFYFDATSKSQFYFDENVYGLIVENDPTGHLYFITYDGPAPPPLNLEPMYALNEKAGTIFCLMGEFRKAPFHHAVSTVSKRRISITFRTVIIE